MEVVSLPSPTAYLTRSHTQPLNAAVSSSAAGHRAKTSFGGASAANRNANMSTHVSHQSSNHSIQSSQPSSRSSDATQGTSHSTLFSAPHLPPGAAAMANGEVTATDNVMNSVADASSSLFQICVSLRQRLLGVPGFREWLEEEEEEADDDTDPVTLLWRTFRRGLPLTMLYDTLNPSRPIQLKGIKEEKIGKAATFKFLQACVNDLKFAQEDCFIVTDLYGDDTTGFVKVARVVNRVLDILVSRGLVDDIRPTASDFEQAAKGMKRSQRQHIVHELVSTERTYVQHLELLQAFKHLVEEKGVIPGDAVHDIFLNLNALLDFQRRFLIRVEQTNAQSEEEQNWGKLFILYCEAFKVYEPYIANQRKCEKTVVAEYAKLKDAGGNLEMRQIVESPTSLYGFLMKPFQRLSKYPLLLGDLYNKGDLDEDRKHDLKLGKEAATSILTRTNKAVDREEKAEAVQELRVRVEDWKGHSVGGFGELLLYGTFTVLKSEHLGSGKDGERQYHVYLFENILLCCKDIDPTKPKNKFSNKQLVDRASGKPKLQLKGRIFMQNVTDLVSLAKPGTLRTATNPDDCHILVRSSQRIFWKGDPSIENFIIRFASEDSMKTWAKQIGAQREVFRDNKSVRNSDGSRHGGTSATEFTYMQNQPAMENPYARQEDEMEEDDEVETLVGSGQPSWVGGYPASAMQRDFSQSRNGSSTSLRSRSTTGDSGGGSGMPTPTPLSAVSAGRAPPPRFPQGSMQQQGLTLRTQLSNGQQILSPSARAEQESYFSPATGDSPQSSSRTSTSSTAGMYPFPRQAMPPQQLQNGYHDEGYTGFSEPGHPPAHGRSRFTAPAMGRQKEPSTNGSSTANGGYAMQQPGRQGVVPRPSFPAGSGLHSAQQMPSLPRHRSASSPDIHNGPPGSGQQRGGVSGTALRSQPPVPDVPAGYHQQQPFGGNGVPRSQSGSPANSQMGNGYGSTRQSPQSHLSRERSYQANGGRHPSQQQQDPSPTSAYASYDAGRPADLRAMSQRHHSSSRSVTPVYPHRSAGTSSPHPSQSSNANPSDTTPPAAGGTGAGGSGAAPSQLKVKVHCPSASQTLTLVVPLTISYQSLKDRIDAKLQRSTNLSLSERPGKESAVVVKLKYLDEEDFVSILSDEDVMTAFETWREQRGGGGGEGGGGAGEGGVGSMGEIELFCQR
ncbi:Guanine nucleotide exchange factor for Cdc42p [Friedmanniomyces endolithicus]|uniref:Guanine nucleotide exchange factor for Cdc42p n=1 Tax=Friedmanniomyces endolithicus TaxID=329885 RepID=A0AAN6FBM1_9PEZI|nr:Guanine nucleotide exchange factor for Cdc42p [Friedmanniomyces endolithicus]